MKPIVDEVARKLRDALKDAMPDFEGLYVFGSQVRGDATDDSDVDIVLVINRDYFDLPDEYYYIYGKMLADYYELIDLDIHTKTWHDLEQNPIFYDEVVNKGVYYG